MTSVFVMMISAAMIHFSCSQNMTHLTFPKTIAPKSHGPSTRVFGGSEAKDNGSFKFMVFAVYKLQSLGTSSCSASLIRDDIVLLAAHCFGSELNPSPSDFRAAAGKVDLQKYVSEIQKDWEKSFDENAFGVQERRGAQIFLHPQYEEETLIHDIALVKTDRPFVLNDAVAVIQISPAEMMSRMLCTIVGWGYSGNIRSLKLLFADHIPAKSFKLNCHVDKNGPFLCLEKASSAICNGDSGSPLICDGKVWGVASHVLSAKLNPDCEDDKIDIYAELYPELQWVDSIITSTRTNPQNASSRQSCFFEILFIAFLMRLIF